MLKLWIYRPDNVEYIYSAGVYFEYEYEPVWIEEQIIKDMILDVDKSEVISGEIIKSPVFGMIPPVRLSGGVKTLIMASHDDTRIYNLSSCGDNCAKWAVMLAREKDIVMRLGHIMNFGDYISEGIEILNTKKIIYTSEELVDIITDTEQDEVSADGW